MGSHSRTITTDSAEAQDFFNQGLTWAYAFNYDEASRSFERSAELDPRCAMAYWGVALANGPHYNNSVMSDTQSKAAWDALQQALKRISPVTIPVRCRFLLLEKGLFDL